MNTKYWMIAITFGLGCLCMGAGGSAKNNFVVTFHIQGSENAPNPEIITPVKLGSEHKQYYFIKIPIFTNHDILWYYPFVSQDGNSHGAAFKLNEEKSKLLTKLSTEHIGKLFGTRVVDAPLRALLIDQPINDGVVVIWDGLAKSHLQVISSQIKHVDAYSTGGQTPDLPSFRGAQPQGNGNTPRPRKPFKLFGNKKKAPKPEPDTNPYANPQ